MARGRFIHGFSLVELMAAAAIMGILVSLALPRYRLFMARSRMAEAKTNLGIIYGLQQTYKAEFEEYGSIPGGMGYGTDGCRADRAGEWAKNELGFRVTDCVELKYRYYSQQVAGANASSLHAGSCSEIYPGCAAPCPGVRDFWEISDERKLSHTSSTIKACSD